MGRKYGISGADDFFLRDEENKRIETGSSPINNEERFATLPSYILRDGKGQRSYFSSGFQNPQYMLVVHESVILSSTETRRWGLLVCRN